MVGKNYNKTLIKLSGKGFQFWNVYMGIVSIFKESIYPCSEVCLEKGEDQLLDLSLVETSTYKCPVKNCNAEIQGDDMAKHFRKSANFIAVKNQ